MSYKKKVSMYNTQKYAHKMVLFCENITDWEWDR